MKKLVRLLSLCLVIVLATSCFASCFKLGNYPDYSDSVTNFNMYAFYGPTDGKMSGGRLMGDGTDFRTKERYQEYKDAGFNILLIENEAAYSGEDWNTSDTKRVMDICFELGLDVILHDRRMWQMAQNHESIIGKEFNGVTINSQKDVNALCEEYMKDYTKHPAFYGIDVMDEPFDVYGTDEFGNPKKSFQMENCLMVVKGIKSVKDVFIHLCLVESRANTYINDYAKEGWSELVYDNYPAMFSYQMGEPQPMQGKAYLRSLEQMAILARDNQMSFTAVTLQAYGGLDQYNGAGGYGWRAVNETDMRYGAYVSMAFCPDNLVWYHYWYDRYGAQGVKDRTCFIGENGEKLMYNVGKQINEEILKFGRVLSHFEFKGVHYYNDERKLPDYYQSDNAYEIYGISVSNVSGEVLISDLYDVEKNQRGFMIVNSKDSSKLMNSSATVKFEGYDYAVIYKKGEPEIVKLKNGAITLDLECADGVLVLPY